MTVENLLQNALGAGPVESRRANGADLQKVDRPDHEESARPRESGKTVEISEEARALSATHTDLQVARAGLESIPEVSVEGVEAARKKVAEGAYATDASARKAAEALARDTMIDAMIAMAAFKRKVVKLARDLPEVDDARVERARRREAAGFYLEMETAFEVTDRILRSQ